jgi:phage gp36-like protein
MPYCLKTDIQKEISDAELIGLTDDAKTGAIVDEKITAAIAKADALIDSYCGGVAEVPFTTVPAVIKQHSITIAIYFLYLRRNRIPEARLQSYKDAIQNLRDIASGKAALPPTTEADFDEQVKTTHTGDDRKITMGKDSDSSSGTLDNY